MANGTQITIQSEDVGTIIKGTAKSRSGSTDTVIDLNDVTAVVIYLRDPDGNLTDHTATATNADGRTDGIWAFTPPPALFSLSPGAWHIQAHYYLAGGTVFYSNNKTFKDGETLI